jgi:hypothetical protein
MFFLQEAHNIDSKTYTRPTYDVSSEGCSQRHQGQGVQKVCPQERHPVPYVPEKDPIQEMVSTLKSDQSLKTTIGEDAELRLPIWHCGTHEAFLMHVSTTLNAIKKQGTFKAYKEAQEAYVEQRNVVKQAKAALALLTATNSKDKKASKKASVKKSPEEAS